ncbi:hypothetical protein ACU686_07230 [Yinghuangia aomiensis]
MTESGAGYVVRDTDDAGRVLREWAGRPEGSGRCARPLSSGRTATSPGRPRPTNSPTP